MQFVFLSLFLWQKKVTKSTYAKASVDGEGQPIP
jgi:hypothetical protein